MTNLQGTAQIPLVFVAALLGLAACHHEQVKQVAASQPNATSETVRFGQGATVALDACSGTSAQEANGTVQLEGNAVWTVGKQGCAVQLDGQSGSVDLAAAVINPNQSFSLAAWILLEDVGQAATAISQDGTLSSAFALRYPGPNSQGQAAGLELVLNSSDVAAPSQVVVQSGVALPRSTWTHVVSVFDGQNKSVSLYVNGTLTAQRAASPAFAGGGHTRLGRGLVAGKPAEFWPGRIDEVSISPTVLASSDVQRLFAEAASTTPVRPPAVPLVVRSPHLSTWLPANQAPGVWPAFWTGTVKAITALLRVDGSNYVVMGNPLNLNTEPASQVQLEVTPTQSKFVFAAGGVSLYLHFSGALDGNDLKNLSAPLGTFTAQVQSTDGSNHNVQLYFDTTAEWAYGDLTAPISWQRSTVASSQGQLLAYSASPASPNVLMEVADYPSWGEMLWATGGNNLTSQDGQDTLVRAQFANTGVLDNSTDAAQPRVVNNKWPVFAFAYDLPATTGNLSPLLTFVLGHVRQPSMSYLGSQLTPLWQTYWSSWQTMVADTFVDAATYVAQLRNGLVDARVHADAVAAGGAHYAALCALALRQAFGGLELVSMANDVWVFLKEISSDGNVSTTDVIYPSMPAYLYASPQLLRSLLTPIFAYAESGHWPQTFAPHDLGASFPNATGHNDGGGENMPVEESANMLLMTAAYAKAASNANATAFVSQHYATLKQWADYLVTNTLDPGSQNQTDDFTGVIAHSSNLALKGIVAVGAMGQLADLAGNSNDAAHYATVATSYIAQWQQLSIDPSAKHLKLAYDQNDTWSLKYNMFPDRLLGLNLVPDSVLKLETAWYLNQAQSFGIPLDSRHSYTKLDWQMWTAAAMDDAASRALLVDQLYNYADNTNTRVPISDWYDTLTGTQTGFAARPVVGGLFSLLARQAMGTLTP